jgi:hypothetical protein
MCCSGKRPYLVIGLLHRSLVDYNRQVFSSSAGFLSEVEITQFLPLLLVGNSLPLNLSSFQEHKLVCEGFS